jgi:hypothetical protein
MERKQKKRPSKSREALPAYISPYKLNRREPFREEREKLLIVCEGEKTERLYFEGFPIPASLVKVHGAGMNTISVVEEAIRLRDEDPERAEMVWCVFDRDSFPAERFNEALALAKRNDINVAYSNEAFELWYLLHYNYHDSKTSRDLYRGMLTDRLGRKYEKNDSTMYDELIDKQEAAIRNARRLLKSHEKNHNPEKDNPCTTVHILVALLRSYQD